MSTVRDRSGSRTGALPVPLFVGFAVASIGGPLALLSLVPQVAGDATDSAGLVVVLALAVFCAPLAIWLAFSRELATPGGLTSFVQAAAGRLPAVAHGWIWAFAYFLYLPYTVTSVVYDVLPPVFPGVSPYRSALELVLPVVLVGVALCPVRWVLAGLSALAVAQIGAMLTVAWVAYRGAHTPFAAHPELDGTGRAVGGVALLFACLSLPLYLGGEVDGGRRTVRIGLATAFALVGAVLLVSAVPLAGVPNGLRDAALPGAAVAQAYSGRALAVAVGLLSAGSILSLIVAEYLALARLLHWLHGPPVQSVLRWIALPFVGLDAISLIDPDRFYDDLLKPSLGALYVSLLIVFAVFPAFRRRSTLALGLAGVASTLAIWGFYVLIGGNAAS